MIRLKSIALFCGSNAGNNDIYLQSATRLGKLLAEKGIELIFGGGNTGLMGAAANAVLEYKGKVTGIIPARLQDRERAHGEIDNLVVVNTMHERKAMMEELADAIIVLPGGIGTLDEFCEIMTWNQLGFINKPTGMLNIEGYYDDFLLMLDNFVKKGFLQQQERDRLIIDTDLERLLEKIRLDYIRRLESKEF